VSACIIWLQIGFFGSLRFSLATSPSTDGHTFAATYFFASLAACSAIPTTFEQSTVILLLIITAFCAKMTVCLIDTIIIVT